jgi:hypothetical protein
MIRKVFSSLVLRAAALCALSFPTHGYATETDALTTAEPAVAPVQERTCDDALLYQTADAHPGIWWITPSGATPAAVALS